MKKLKPNRGWLSIVFLIFITGMGYYLFQTDSIKQSSVEEVEWVDYENKYIRFRYPKDKRVHDIHDGPAEISKYFEFYGDGGARTMVISIFDIPEDTDKVFSRVISTKTLVEQSRNNKIKRDGENSVLEPNELNLNELRGHYYDFSESFISDEASFAVEGGCGRYRAAYLKRENELLRVVYCLRQPYIDIFNTISLK